MKDTVVRQRSYFESEEFNCSPFQLLFELSQRAEYWSKLTDGSYSVPLGQDGQIYEMAIAANLKGIPKQVIWRDLEIGEKVKAGDRFYNAKISNWIIVGEEDVHVRSVTKTSYPFQRKINLTF